MDASVDAAIATATCSFYTPTITIYGMFSTTESDSAVTAVAVSDSAVTSISIADAIA